MNNSVDHLPLVSILIPTYQGEKFLKETLISAVSQTYENLEIIVSDDGSTDRTLEIAESFRQISPCKFSILTHENLGMVNHWNFCISQAQGDYIKFLFQDDLLEKNCIEEMVNLAQQNADIGLVFSHRDIILTEAGMNSEICIGIQKGCSNLTKYWSKLSLIQEGKDLLNDLQFLEAPLNKIGEPSTVLIRKKVFDEIGGFDPSLYQLVDVEMWTRILLHYKIGFLDKTLSYFRVHPDQQTIKNTEAGEGIRDHLKFYKKLLIDPCYQSLPLSLKTKIYDNLERERARLKQDKEDLTEQRDRGNLRIKQLEEHESALEKELRKTQGDFFRVVSELEEAYSKIQSLESRKFRNMKNGWLKLKKYIKLERFNQVFKIKQLLKKFIFVSSEEGLGTALWRTQRKFLKKLVKVLTGKTIFQADIEVLQSSQLEDPHPITINTSETPLVSIIIPVYNKFLYTFNCLKSLSKNLDDSLKVEVIVVDDASTDETEKDIEMISGIRVLRNPENKGFIRSCNFGASQARGKLLYFLNNDTQILPNCVESLVTLIENDPQVGAVGSKLIYPNGRLQEAGGIIWQDATGWNYGRLQSPEEPEYNYIREVDYCSGASLLVRAELFNQLGGFSEEFLPAYYEDTDLCFAIRNLGYKVLYQPQSKLVHYEGITSGTSLTSGVKQYQEVNRTKFQTKWQEVLKKHYANDPEKVPQAARRLQNESKILIIDSYVPLYDRESGCVRLLNILKILKNLGYSILFLPDNGNPEEPYTSTLQAIGIEVLYCTPEQWNLEEQLLKRLPLVDVVWLCRPELCEKYLDGIRHYSKVPVIYDTIDLHFLRIKRQQEYFPNADQNTTWSWETYQKQEVKFAQAVEATVVVTENEKSTLKELGVNNVWVIPNIHNVFQGHFPSFEERSELVFIGSYNHPPNIDAVIWLCQEIMPLVWQSHPDIKVRLLGSNMKEEVEALKSDRVIVTGYVEDVEPYFLKSRVFVAPLRFGAGMKGKIGHSMSYALPTVTTTIGAEGMGLKDNYDVLIADTSESFAQKIIELYNQSELWNFISENSLTSIQRYGPESVEKQLGELLNYLDKLGQE